MAEQRRPRVAPDRQRVSTMRLWGMTILAGAMVWAALASLVSTNARLSSGTVAQASGVVAVLAVFGLRSVPVRWIIRGLALFTGVLLARFGQLGVTGGLSGSWRVLVWLVALGLALTLSPSSRSVVVGADDSRADGSEGRGGANGSRGRSVSVPSPVRGRIPAAVAVAALSFVVGGALVGGPRAANWFPAGARASDLVDHSRNNADNVMVSRESLDMTSRPRLSDTVIMTVRSPTVSFWRAELFDRWDGTVWTRSYERAGSILVGGKVTPAADDIAARGGTESTQQYKLESGFATVMPAAPSAVSVTSSNEVAQRIDGTLVSVSQPLGSGTTYTVKSRQMQLSSDLLRNTPSARSAAKSDRTAATVMSQYGSKPAISDRVAELARSQTSGATNDFDRILALERWMSLHTTYSLDAPLSPRGVDVVDHFLFESKVGWCEQIATSLVVMARSVGIPARLATGYAPGEWDSAGSRFVVRERDAHAWAEVWFPASGWVPFDPTASVPLTGTDAAKAGAGARDWREIVGMVLLAIGVVSVAAAPTARLVVRLLAALRRRRASSNDVAQRWEVRAARRLERAGERAGPVRARHESLGSYGTRISRLTDDQRFEEVGVALDQVTYSSSLLAPRDDDPSRVRVEALLDEIETSASAQERVAEPV